MWDHSIERRQDHSCAGNSLPQSGLYVLKHKDLDVAMVQIDMHTGRIGYVLAVYHPEKLPAGISRDAEVCRSGGLSAQSRIPVVDCAGY